MLLFFYSYITIAKQVHDFQVKVSYKFFWTREVKQLDHAKVIACYKADSRVRNTGTIYIGFLSMPGPNPNNFIS